MWRGASAISFSCRHCGVWVVTETLRRNAQTCSRRCGGKVSQKSKRHSSGISFECRACGIWVIRDSKKRCIAGFCSHRCHGTFHPKKIDAVSFFCVGCGEWTVKHKARMSRGHSACSIRCATPAKQTWTVRDIRCRACGVMFSGRVECDRYCTPECRQDASAVTGPLRMVALGDGSLLISAVRWLRLNRKVKQMEAT